MLVAAAGKLKSEGLVQYCIVAFYAINGDSR